MDFRISSFHTGSKNIGSEIDFEPSLISPRQKDREKRISFIKKAMDLASQLNVKAVTITSGIVRDNISFPTIERYLNESIEQILKHAEDKKVDISIENEMGMHVMTTDDLVKNVDRYNGNLWATLDIGHCHCCNEDIIESIDRLDGKIRHMHFEDILDRAKVSFQEINEKFIR